MSKNIKTFSLISGVDSIEKMLKKNDIILVEANESYFGPVHVARAGFYQRCVRNADPYSNGHKRDVLWYKPAIDKTGKNIAFHINISDIKEIKVLGNIEEFYHIELK